MKIGKKQFHIAYLLGLVVMAAVFICLAPMRTKAAGEQKRVLFISSYSYGWDTVKLQIDGMEETFPKDYVLDYEFMDTYRVNDTNALRLFYENIKYHLSRATDYDVILVGDDAAFKFVIRYQDELFKGIPIVFMGVNDSDYALAVSKDPLVTGIIQNLDYKTTIDVAMNVLPKADTVVAILDDSQTGQIERKKYYKVRQYFPELKFQEINVSNLSPGDVSKKIAEIPYNTILLYVSLTNDNGDTLYFPEDARKLVVGNTRIPVFVLMESDTDCGTLGGATFSMKESAIDASKMVIEIAEGRKQASDYEVVNVTSHPMRIDTIIMQNYRINKKIFPHNTVFINKKQTFFEKYGDVIKPVLVIMLVSGAIIAFVLFDNYKRRKMMKEITEMKDHLENASQHDFLTGLGNRSKFMADLAELMKNDTPCSVIMLDLDNFKGINDTMGHAMGDEALKGVAGRLKNMSTPLFTPYRFAGDEFIMILKSDNEKIVENAVRQCWQVFQKPYRMLNTVMDIHGSIGVATAPQDTTDMEQLIVCADDAMYEIKKEGKNGVAYYRDLKQRLNEEMAIKQQMEDERLAKEQEEMASKQEEPTPLFKAPGSILNGK